MKFILIGCILLTVSLKGFSQDSLYIKNILSEIDKFNRDSFSINRYKQFPKYIRHYIHKKRGRKLKLAMRNYNATDIRSPRLLNRKFMYAGGSSNIYVLAYEHGGIGHHVHILVFRTNGKEVLSFYPLLGGLTHNLSEFENLVKTDYFVFDVQPHF
jgi:hypothetical protein